MSVSPSAGGRSKSLVLAAMIFAVSMTFIDQTIVSIAAPTIQHDLGLSSSGMQWAINAYLLSLAALFAFGGRLADTVGPRKMVVLGVIIFAGSSVLCGLTPTGGIAEAWLVTFRAVQGLGGAIMFPAALAIVVQTFELHSRGRALALFFGVAGGLTAVGPIAGGYLIEWTWRAIFWINVPVALIALALIAISKPANVHRPAPMDYRGLALIVSGVALSVFGFQQAALWGWSDPAIEVCIVAGVALLGVFYFVERRTESPLMNVHIFANQAFLGRERYPRHRHDGVHSGVLLRQRLRAGRPGREGHHVQPADLVLLPRLRGLRADRRPDAGPGRGQAAGGARQRARGRGVRAVGREDDRPARRRSGDLYRHGRGGHGAHARPGQHRRGNRASRYSYGEATGITQTVRNYGASLGFAILGTILITEFRSRITSSLVAKGLPQGAASAQAAKIAQLQGGSGNVAAIPAFIRADFAGATRDVFYVMAGIMAVAALVALRGLKRGRQEEPAEAVGLTTGMPGQEPGADLFPSESR